MRTSWNKGLTKETNKSVKQTSLTMKKKKVYNFSRWREKMIKSGQIKSVYKDLKRDGNLAELIGVVLGDGHIGIFPRTERLLIFLTPRIEVLLKDTLILWKKFLIKNRLFQI